MMLESGEQMRRPEGGKPPCHQCPKTPRDLPRTRENAIEPTERSWDAIRHFQRCSTTGRFPDDEIVERNAGLIGPIEKDSESAKARDAAGLIALMLSKR